MRSPAPAPDGRLRRQGSWGASSSEVTKSPVTSLTRVFSFCFCSKDVKSSVMVDSENFKPTFAPSPLSSHASSGDSFHSKDKAKIRGIYGLSNNPSEREPGGIIFSIQEIQKATKNFSSSLKIGQGGSGTVYRGQLQDGTLVAVKRAKKRVYDNRLSAEFKNEIQTLARIEHLSLVRLHGYLEDEQETIVVMEYVNNGTLREHLDCLRGKPLDLATRLDIAIEVAHAVTYLHMYSDHPIIHRDIKSSNILLTDNLRAKVADFGFARLAASEAGVTHVSTQVRGTAGYLDPEYLQTYQLSKKSDVYSFGVLLVEIITGRRPIEPKREVKERITVKWVMKKFTEGNASQVLDSHILVDSTTTLVVEQILELALQCLAPTKKHRPSMQKCAEILWTIRKNYREGQHSDPPLEPLDEKKSSEDEQND